MRIRFNSKMVRLKEDTAVGVVSRAIGFNSKMVRLEEEELENHEIAEELFQFQNGSIRSHTKHRIHNRFQIVARCRIAVQVNAPCVF